MRPRIIHVYCTTSMLLLGFFSPKRTLGFLSSSGSQGFLYLLISFVTMARSYSRIVASHLLPSNLSYRVVRLDLDLC